MTQSVFRLEHNRQLTGDTFELRLSGDASAITAPGQFVNIALPGYFLRRPVSVCDWTENSLTLLIKTAGGGTEQLAHSPTGTEFDILCGLGNGFTLPENKKSVILAGGGIGIAPLYALAKQLRQNGVSPVIALGFRTAADVFYTDEFAALDCEMAIATEDGSKGEKGFVTDILRQYPDCDYVYCCGPLPMLRAVHALSHWTGGQFSFEARMGCGFGACMGCSIPTANGYRRVCKEGPVFQREEIVW